MSKRPKRLTRRERRTLRGLIFDDPPIAFAGTIEEYIDRLAQCFLSGVPFTLDLPARAPGGRMMTVEELRSLAHRQAGEIEFRLKQFVQILKAETWGPSHDAHPVQNCETASSILDAARKLVLTFDAIRGLEEQEEERRREASRAPTADV